MIGTGIQYRELTGLNVDAAATYQMGVESLRIARLNISGPVGHIAGDGELALGGVGDSHLNATVEALNAESLMRSLRLEYRVASRVDGRIDARWTGNNYAAATGEAQLVLTPNRDNAVATTLPVGGRIDIAGNGDRAVATLRNVRAAGTELDGRVTLGNRQTLDGTLRAHSANVQSTINSIETFLGRRRGSLAPMRIGGVLTADGRVRGTLYGPILTFTIDAPVLRAGDATGISLTVT